MTRYYRSRRGMASLELVLVAPFLLALTTGLFLAGRAAIAKAGTATQARHDAFRNRETVNPGTPFNPVAQAGAGEAGAGVEKKIASGYLLRQTTFAAKSEARVVGHAWDSRVLLSAPPTREVGVHQADLARLVPIVPGVGQGAAATIDGLALVLDPKGNEVGKIIAALNGPANATVVATGVAMGVAADAIKASKKNPLFLALEFARDLADFLEQDWIEKPLSTMIAVWDPFGDALDNLSLASQGKEGHWGLGVEDLKKIPEVVK